MTDIPMQRLSLPAMCLSVLEGGWDHRAVLISSVIWLTCLTPWLSSVSHWAAQGESSEKKSDRDWPISCANCSTPKQLISSLWRLVPVMIETVQKFSWQTEGRPGMLQDICDCRNAMSSGLQALYLMFSRATQSFTSAWRSSLKTGKRPETDWTTVLVFHI